VKSINNSTVLFYAFKFIRYDLWSIYIPPIIVSVTDTTPTLMIILNYIIFLNYYWYRWVNVRVVSDVRIYVRVVFGVRICVRRVWYILKAKYEGSHLIDDIGFLKELICMSIIPKKDIVCPLFIYLLYF
jgi:hypothetical protein